MQAFLDARANADGTCTIDASIALGNPDTGELVQCDVDIDSITDALEETIVVTAGAEAAAAVCDPAVDEVVNDVDIATVRPSPLRTVLF